MDPNGARWIMIGRFLLPSVRREGADAGTMKVDDFVAWFKAEMAKELV